MDKLTIIFFFLGSIPLSCVAQTESLLIGRGDLIEIDVFDTPQMMQEVRVNDAGVVTLGLVGELKLGGLTPAVASKIVERALVDKKIMRAPHVSIKIEDYATQDVSVLGQVKNPGTFTITTPQPVPKALALAGGLTDVADRNVTIERHSDPSERVHYYLANNADQALANDPMVYPGDIVIVPRAPVIYILGDVAKPGGYAIATNDSRLTVLQAIAMAGSANKTSTRFSLLTSHATA